MGISVLAMFSLALAAPAQQQQQLMTDPQIIGIFTGIAQHAARMEPMLQQLRPNEWVAKGAPDTYVMQWNSQIEQLHAIQSDMLALGQHPDQITECMKALFRVQASDQGARLYW